VKDLQLYLEKNVQIKVPGHTDLDSPLHVYRKTIPLDDHKKRLQMVRRGLYNFQKQVEKQKHQQQQQQASK
jgi:transcription initiation factor TFIID subunit TAF12